MKIYLIYLYAIWFIEHNNFDHLTLDSHYRGLVVINLKRGFNTIVNMVIFLSRKKSRNKYCTITLSTIDIFRRVSRVRWGAGIQKAHMMVYYYYSNFSPPDRYRRRQFHLGRPWFRFNIKKYKSTRTSGFFGGRGRGRGIRKEFVDFCSFGRNAQSVGASERERERGVRVPTALDTERHLAR